MKKRTLLLSITIITIISAVLPAQDKSVDFLSTTPVIDGKLDDSLESLPVRQFGNLDKTSDTNPDTRATYRLGWTMDHLYIFIESDQESIDARDRGYQNGDGFHVVIASPMEDGSPANKFYVLSFTPTQRSSAAWQRQFIWYKDIDVSFVQLKQTQFKESCSAGKAGYELLVPWKELYPYHPGINKIGFNMCFVRALPELQRNFHYVIYDRKIQNEESLRKYKVMDFQTPTRQEKGQAYAIVKRNITEGESITIETFRTGDFKQLNVVVKDFMGDEIHREKFDFLVDSFTRLDNSAKDKKKQVPVLEKGVFKGPGMQIFSFYNPKLTQGDYTIELPGEDFESSYKISVLPEFSKQEIEKRLLNLDGKLSSGSLATLLFKLQEIDAAMSKITPYDDASQLRFDMVQMKIALREGMKGKDYLAENRPTGKVRRAYRSKFDNSIQPYSIALPPNYDPEKKYPMLIWLHGSGVDDRNSPLDHFSQGGLIALAPNGRGPTTAYCKNNSQVDIKEVIDEICNEFSVDRSKIILCGFSMGGYGVYRSHFETPEKYRALAVFSGHPNLPYGDIDFLKEENAKIFKDKEIFVFHGDLDRNCPMERTLKMVEVLKSVGAKVEFHLEEGVGHSQPGATIQNAFRQWLIRIITAE